MAVRPEDVEGGLDIDLARMLPANTKVHWARAWPFRWTRRLGWGSLARRSYGGLQRLGNRLLATGRFDLVFFSTTQFGVLPLSRYWKRHFHVPYVLDFQDEWVGSYHRRKGNLRPPGGLLKYTLTQWLARHQEPEVIQGAAGIISVSPTYLAHLQERYPLLPPERLKVLPFGGSSSDFEALTTLGVTQNFFDPDDGRRHWVGVGRGGADLHQAVAAFFAALRRALDEGLIEQDSVRIHFIGTSYAPEDLARTSFTDLAAHWGLTHLVEEHAPRVPYLVALCCLRQAHAILVPGSDDAGYHPSKIYPALLAERPLLAMLREDSSALAVLQRTGTGTAVTFSSGETNAEIAQRIYTRWFLARAYNRQPEKVGVSFAPFTAETMTRQLGEIFTEAVAQETSAR